MNVTSTSQTVSKQPCFIPLFTSNISAGFPSPADDYKENDLDLNELLIRNPAATFYVRAVGDSMQHAGIYNNDLLIVDRSLKAGNGCIVIAVVENEYTVKRLKKINGKFFLTSENDKDSPIEVTHEKEVTIWGVVHSLVRQFK